MIADDRVIEIESDDDDGDSDDNSAKLSALCQ